MSVLKLHPKVIFRQIWSQKLWSSPNRLKFGSWYIAISLFQIQYLFFQSFFHSYFLGKFDPKIWSSPNKLKFNTGVHCYMLDTILMFSFSKFYHSYNFGQIWVKPNVIHIDWNLIQWYIVMYWLTLLMCNFSKYLLFINFWGKFHPKICCSPHLLKFSVEIRCNSANIEKTRWTKISQ